jgi:hypothetical protein
MLHPLRPKHSWKLASRNEMIRKEWVRSDHPFTKRSGDMVYTSVLD